jgi:hypothetical protein
VRLSINQTGLGFGYVRFLTIERGYTRTLSAMIERVDIGLWWLESLEPDAPVHLYASMGSKSEGWTDSWISKEWRCKKCIDATLEQRNRPRSWGWLFDFILFDVASLHSQVQSSRKDDIPKGIRMYLWFNEPKVGIGVGCVGALKPWPLEECTGRLPRMDRQTDSAIPAS